VAVLGRAIGLDVGLDFCEVAVCEEDKVRSAGRVKSKLAELQALADSLLPTDRVALEVTGSAWEIVGILEPRVAEVVVVSPGDGHLPGSGEDRSAGCAHAGEASVGRRAGGCMAAE